MSNSQEISEEELFHDAVKRLLRVSNRVLKTIHPRSPTYHELSEAIADVEPFFESNDPAQNGWVGSDGRP